MNENFDITLPEKPKKSGHAFWIIFAVVSLILLVFFGIYIIKFANKQLSEFMQTKVNVGEIGQPLPSPDKELLITGIGNFWIGTSSPELTIVQFSDFSCPYCLESFPMLREVSLRYADRVKIIFRSFPTHEDSLSKAMSAYCAGEQGFFWQMHDKLFQNQQDIVDLTLLAKQTGLDIDKWQNCFQTEKYLPMLKKDYSDAGALGVAGTPTWFFGNDKYAGGMSHDDFVGLVESYLQ